MDDENDDGLTPVLQLFADLKSPWAVCGGWAIDLFLGHNTRPHKDVDIAVWRADQLVIQTYLQARGWTLKIAHQGKLTHWETGVFIHLPMHTIWCKHADDEPDFVEVLLNEADGTHFLFRRNPAIKRVRNRAFLNTNDDIPYLAPEIVLLYKSNNIEHEGNAADFQATFPALKPDQRAWLKSALTMMYEAEHAWIKQL